MWIFFWAVIISALVLSLVVVDMTQELLVVEETLEEVEVISQNRIVSPYDDTPIIRRLQNLYQLLNVEHVVVWGHPLHSHTHSYIHEAFVAAAERSGIHTVWTNVTENCPVHNTVFITEGQVMQGMPASAESWYILHNCPHNPENVPDNRIIMLQFYHFNCEVDSVPIFDRFQRLSTNTKGVFMPWATNVLPHEDVYPFVPLESEPEVRSVHVVGQSGSQYTDRIDEFVGALPTGESKRVTGLSQLEMIEFLRQGYCAPALINNWQKEHGYIPCRIMKNISYGRLGVTTSWAAKEMLKNNVVFDLDERTLATKLLQITPPQAESLYQASKHLIMTRHTYLNRLEFLLAALYYRKCAKNLSVSINVDPSDVGLLHVYDDLNWQRTPADVNITVDEYQITITFQDKVRVINSDDVFVEGPFAGLIIPTVLPVDDHENPIFTVKTSQDILDLGDVLRLQPGEKLDIVSYLRKGILVMLPEDATCCDPVLKPLVLQDTNETNDFELAWAKLTEWRQEQTDSVIRMWSFVTQIWW